MTSTAPTPSSPTLEEFLSYDREAVRAHARGVLVSGGFLATTMELWDRNAGVDFSPADYLKGLYMEYWLAVTSDGFPKTAAIALANNARAMVGMPMIEGLDAVVLTTFIPKG
jgi:hypothetical protein